MSADDPNSRIAQLVALSDAALPGVKFFPHRKAGVYTGQLPIGIWSVLSHGAEHRESGWTGSVAGTGNAYLLRLLYGAYNADAATEAEDAAMVDDYWTLRKVLVSADGSDGNLPNVVDTISIQMEKPEYLEYLSKYVGLLIVVRFEERYEE